jgi:2-keto-4-pentenoate hydratase
MQPLPGGLDLGGVTLQVLVNGEVVDQAKGTAVLDTPAGSVAWLANRLGDFGRRLEPGMQIMSGSFTKQIAITKGDVLEARFDPVGSVTVEFT